MDNFDIQSPRTSYENELRTAMSMSVSDIEARLKWLQNLSDDPNERISTAGMQLEFSALQEALEKKMNQ